MPTGKTGRLLQVLASSIARGVIGELGTGYGYGTAWLSAGLRLHSKLYSVEHDETLARSAQALFQHREHIHIISGDWRDLLPYGPFDLLFVDVSEAKLDYPELALNAVAPGGIVVIDDLTPVRQWPEACRGQPDNVRDYWLSPEHLSATEIMLTPQNAAIIATRR